MALWNNHVQESTVTQTKVFSGGACNIVEENMTLKRNMERDRINEWLDEHAIKFFDPQIHPDTHGVEYDFDVHYPLEMKARNAAKINLYEVSPLTFGGITSLEIAADQFQWNEPMVIYFSDGDPDNDVIPAHTSKGEPLFAPHGIKSNIDLMRFHYKEMIKNANNMRRYLTKMANDMTTLTINFSNIAHKNDVVISPERMHAADIFTSVVKAASGERVFVTFSGGPEAQDDKGNALFIAPKNPREIEMQVLLDQYVDEGIALRRAITQLVRINVYSRVVYTQQSAILALKEVLQITGTMAN